MHTRVSEELSESVRRAAEELRVPVSNLVRNVLEEAFAAVETVTDNVGDLLDEVLEGTERVRRRSRHRAKVQVEPDDAASARASSDARPSDDPAILGWQLLILNQPQVCGDCGRKLQRGDRGFAGATAGGLSSTYVCQDCIRERD